MTLTIELGEKTRNVCFTGYMKTEQSAAVEEPSRASVTRNFEDYVSDIFNVCLSIKKALSFLLALVPVLLGCHPHIYLSL